MKVSIIMPVYNSRQYLEQAVSSILDQKFNDYELLLVDDGSTDGSGEICDQLANKSDKIIVIHKKNGGVCSARNAGLDAARGEFIGFCDNDDQILPDHLKDNYETAVRENADLIRFNRIKRYVKDDGSYFDSVLDLKDLTVTRSEYGRYFRYIRQNAVWTALYKRRIIVEHHIRFNEDMHQGIEDLNFNLQFFIHCEKMVIQKRPYYLWIQRELHSASRKFSIESANSWFFNLPLEYIFDNEICGEGLDRFERDICMINIYVYQLVEYMSIPSCRISTREKCSILQKMREQKVFAKGISEDVLYKMWHENKRIWITTKWFYEKKFRKLLFFVGKGTRLLADLRTRKLVQQG